MTNKTKIVRRNKHEKKIIKKYRLENFALHNSFASNWTFGNIFS